MTRPLPVISAYHPSRSVTAQRVDLTGNAAPPPLRLTLDEPFKRTLTVLDSEGRPLAGVRLAPLRSTFFDIPDDWLERLTVVTTADGTATIMCLPVTIDPLSVRAIAPGIAPHSLPLPRRPGSDRFTLNLGRPARIAGSLAYDSGEPAGDIPVEVWVQNMLYRPAGTGELTSIRPTLIHFDSGPLRSRKDGSFETPPQLLTGSSYRITIQPEGGSVINSDWIIATTELTNAPPLRLPSHRKLFGLVQDRQGHAVSGARVALPSGSPSTATDAQGRFQLEGVLPERTYLLVAAPGFRFQGRQAVPAADVIKIEAPPGVDPNEGMSGPRDGYDMVNLHRNKRTMTLNLKEPDGRAIFLRLAATADVVVENFRPDVKDRMGIDYETLRGVNPRIILASISGFGQTGPYRMRAGFDQIAQGMGGLMWVTGVPGEGPMRAGIAVADSAAGVYAATGIMIALAERERSGQGQWVQSSLLAAQIAMMDFQAARYLVDGEVPPQAGNEHPYATPMGVLATADGFINIGVGGDGQWRALCRALERPDLGVRSAVRDAGVAFQRASEADGAAQGHLCDTALRRLARPAGAARRARRTDLQGGRGVRRPAGRASPALRSR